MAKKPISMDVTLPPTVMVEQTEDTPVRQLNSTELTNLGQKLELLFVQYVSDRRVGELKWLRNLRQYLGIYDPDIEKELSANRSKAYPRVTRVKCISMVSRVMNLMFPGNERNWELNASPNADMDPKDVMQAIHDAIKKHQAAGPSAPVLSDDDVQAAIQVLADKRAEDLSKVLDDQLQELGGDQTLDYVSLNRQVIKSGVIYGIGALEGPYVRSEQITKWSIDPTTGQPKPKKKTAYKPMFEFLPIWDFYPDMSAKTLSSMDGYFTRKVMARSQVLKLTEREDFFEDVITTYLERNTTGNWRPQPYETELRAMGIKVNVNEQKTESTKYEVIIWHGPISGSTLKAIGIDVDSDKTAYDIECEIWMIAGQVIKADINEWRKLGMDVKMIHTFLFDEDDTSVIGNGLPNVVRDSQMSIAASTRMMLDNASVICGPNMELNTDLLRPDQDLTSTAAYKMWYREGTGPEAQYPAIRNLQIDGHLDELQKLVDSFMKFADLETFIGPATGGDMQQPPSEPLRTAAGASMWRGDAALPFKDVVRSFDFFTQSVILSMVMFNRKFNPDMAPEGDFDVIARGATSLIAKEVRGMQVDQLATTLTPEENMHVDHRKLIEARFAARDLKDMLIPAQDAEANIAAAQAKQDAKDAQESQMLQATMQEALANAFKNIAQGNKNSTSQDATAVETAIKILQAGLEQQLGGQQPVESSPQAQPPAQPPMTPSTPPPLGLNTQSLAGALDALGPEDDNNAPPINGAIASTQTSGGDNPLNSTQGMA